MLSVLYYTAINVSVVKIYKIVALLLQFDSHADVLLEYMYQVYAL